MSNSSVFLDPVRLAQALIRCPSITPDEGGSLDLLESHLNTLGFSCSRLEFSDPGSPPVQNLYARIGTAAPHLCFAGHVDVVPAGDKNQWQADPFAGVIRDNVLYGRGAVDMKGSIASFVTAVDSYLKTHSLKGSLSFLITADEEGIAINGTKKVLNWLETRQEKLDFCLVGEPSSQEKLGDTIKIGRRGSLNTVLTVHGIQGHVAYPERALNPVPLLMKCLSLINEGPEEPKNPFFAATNVEITSIDVGNPTVNVIPAQATGRFNIRFSDFQTGSSLQKWIKDICDKHGGNYNLEFSLSGEAEYLEPEHYTQALGNCIKDITGLTPEYTTAGGTSDAHFIRHYAPVIEFGLVGQTMHQVNECVACEDLVKLSRIYSGFIESFFQDNFKT